LAGSPICWGIHHGEYIAETTAVVEPSSHHCHIIHAIIIFVVYRSWRQQP
jgi:hypothetical protein